MKKWYHWLIALIPLVGITQFDNIDTGDDGLGGAGKQAFLMFYQVLSIIITPILVFNLTQ